MLGIIPAYRTMSWSWQMKYIRQWLLDCQNTTNVGHIWTYVLTNAFFVTYVQASSIEYGLHHTPDAKQLIPHLCHFFLLRGLSRRHKQNRMAPTWPLCVWWAMKLSLVTRLKCTFCWNTVWKDYCWICTGIFFVGKEYLIRNQKLSNQILICQIVINWFIIN